jgi:Na+/H+ antiporter NhaC
MDLVLFSLYVALMGALSFLIALLTRLHTQAKRGEVRNTPDAPIDVEKLRDFKAAMLPLAVALVLVIIAFIIVFLLPPPPPCTTPNVCNYLMSI